MMVNKDPGKLCGEFKTESTTILSCKSFVQNRVVPRTAQVKFQLDI